MRFFERTENNVCKFAEICRYGNKIFIIMLKFVDKMRKMWYYIGWYKVYTFTEGDRVWPSYYLQI